MPGASFLQAGPEMRPSGPGKSLAVRPRICTDQNWRDGSALSALSARAEDPSRVSRAHVGHSELPGILLQRDLSPSSGPCTPTCNTHTHRNTNKHVKITLVILLPRCAGIQHLSRRACTLARILTVHHPPCQPIPRDPSQGAPLSAQAAVTSPGPPSPAALVLSLAALFKQGGLIEGHAAAGGTGG